MSGQGTSKRVIVCGSRRWHDRDLIALVLSGLMIERGWNPVIVHGACRGADRIADEEAGKLGFLTDPHPADWDKHGKAAGPIRNREMAQLGADLCIAFGPTPGSGTKDMVDRAAKHGIPVEIHYANSSASTTATLSPPITSPDACSCVSSEEATGLG